MTRVNSYRRNEHKDKRNEIKLAFLHVQHIQNAVSTFISVVLSDGCMMIVLLISSFYVLPVAGVINSLYILSTIFLEIQKLPELVFQANRTKLLSAASEKALISYAQQPDVPDANEYYNINYKFVL